MYAEKKQVNFLSVTLTWKVTYSLSSFPCLPSPEVYVRLETLTYGE